MGQGLGALLAPSRPCRQRAPAAVPFAEIASCVSDALDHRLRCVPHPSQSDLFDGALSHRPTAADVAVASWVQVCSAGVTADVVVVSTINDAVVYVASRPLLAVERGDALRYVAEGALPLDLLLSDRRDI